MVTVGTSDSSAELDVELKTQSAVTHGTNHLLKNIQLWNEIPYYEKHYIWLPSDRNDCLYF